MKNKKLMWIFIIVVGLVCGFMYMAARGYVSNKTVYEYKYSKPWNFLPKSKELTFEESKKFADMKDGKFVCIATGLEPIREELFTKKYLFSSCDTHSAGCWDSYSRDTIVCGNQYMITESHSYGPSMYGVFSF